MRIVNVGVVTTALFLTACTRQEAAPPAPASGTGPTTMSTETPAAAAQSNSEDASQSGGDKVAPATGGDKVGPTATPGAGATVPQEAAPATNH